MVPPSITQPSGSNCTPVFVGIDFGTTFSGLAYNIGESSEQTNFVDWGSDHLSPKFPTKVTISNETILCGAQIPDGEESIQWFKLALLHSDDLDDEIEKSPLFQEHEAFRKKLKLKAYEVVKHLFDYMWAKFLDALHSTSPGGTYSFHLTIAVPANWPQYIFDAIEKAIVESGIRRQIHGLVSFVSEPEATILTAAAEPAIILVSLCFAKLGPSLLRSLGIGWQYTGKCFGPEVSEG
ncbi:hypothetical protein AUP68_06482 [Ilyonectria robusta]